MHLIKKKYISSENRLRELGLFNMEKRRFPMAASQYLKETYKAVGRGAFYKGM